MAVCLIKHLDIKTCREVEIRFHTFFIFTLGGCEPSTSRPGHFILSKKAPYIQWTGSWVGRRFRLDAVAKTKIPFPVSMLMTVVRPGAWSLWPLRFRLLENRFSDVNYIGDKNGRSGCTQVVFRIGPQNSLEILCKFLHCIFLNTLPEKATNE